METPGALKQVVLTPHDIPKILTERTISSNENISQHVQMDGLHVSRKSSIIVDVASEILTISKLPWISHLSNIYLKVAWSPNIP